MKVICSVISLLIIVFIILASYIIRGGHQGLEQGQWQWQMREAFGVSPGTTHAFSMGTGGREAFGVSPGTLTQLAANHVTTAEDIPMLKQWLAQRQQGIWQMTESDLVGNAPMEYSLLGSRIGAFA